MPINMSIEYPKLERKCSILISEKSELLEALQKMVFLLTPHKINLDQDGKLQLHHAKTVMMKYQAENNLNKLLEEFDDESNFIGEY